MKMSRETDFKTLSFCRLKLQMKREVPAAQTDLDSIISNLLKEGLSKRQIKRIARVGSDRIDAVEKGKPQNHMRGKPPRIGPEIWEFIEHVSLMDARLNHNEIRRLVRLRFGEDVSVPSICQIRKTLKFTRQRPKIVQLLTDIQKRQRVQFAKEMLDALEQGHMVIIFSDECRFCLESDGTCVYVRRGQWNSTAYVQKENFPKGTMYWAAVGPGFKSKLIKCGASEDADDYIRILQEAQLVEKLDEKFGQCGYSFMQDGATCHTSEKAMEWLRPKMKIVEGWPANSPDLNPIEMLWAVMKGQLKTRNPVDVAQLESFVEEIWDGIDQQVIDHLVSDFKRRLRLVVDMKGETISAMLSSHMDAPNPQLLAEVASKPTPVLIDRDEDNHIMSLHSTLGNKWTAIARQIGTERTWREIRQRVATLEQRAQNSALTEARKHLEKAVHTHESAPSMPIQSHVQIHMNALIAS